ncbi:MAG: M56 family metallopeptidase [Alistipes finegoldii]
MLVRIGRSVTPFSWYRYIVLSEKDLAENGDAIVLHEKAHLRLRHSVDLLLTDLAGCLQWFNPAMWLLRRELRAIHEYEADEAVLDSGVDAKHYQLLLIRKLPAEVVLSRQQL